MRKIIGVILLSLFMMSMTSNSSKSLEKEMDCLDQVHIFVTQADNSGFFTEEEIQWWANGALAVYCYGYSWDDVFNAP